MSRRVMLHYITSFHVIMSRHVIPHHATWCTSCHVMPHHVTSCHISNVTSCHVTSHHVTSYHVESRGTVTRPTLHCQLTSSTRNQFKLSMTVFVGCPEGCRYHTASAVYDLVIIIIITIIIIIKKNMIAPVAPRWILGAVIGYQAVVALADCRGIMLSTTSYTGCSSRHRRNQRAWLVMAQISVMHAHSVAVRFKSRPWDVPDTGTVTLSKDILCRALLRKMPHFEKLLNTREWGRDRIS